MLSILQKKLLKLLAINSWYTNKDIAKSLSVSEDTVKYQIDNLLVKKGLATFSTKFDYWMLGFFDYHYLVRLKDISQLPVEKLSALPNVSFWNTCYGKYDVQFIIVARNPLELEKTIRAIDSFLINNIQDTTVCHANLVYKYTNVVPPIQCEVKLPKNQKNIVYSKNRENFIFDSCEPFSIDKIDLKIIQYLLHNPRASYLEISRHTSLARDTVRKRIKQYVVTNFIRTFSININYNKFGYFTNFVLMKFRNIDETRLSNYFKNESRIFYAARLTGEYTCIFYTLTKDTLEFGQLVNSLRAEFKESILLSDLFYFHYIYKYVQFPEILFEDL